jgi:3-hydroxybutyryl-CoA dehydrogenase
MEIKRVVIAGSGTMGNGIAQVCALAGLETLLYDIDSALLIKAENTVIKNLNKAVELGKLQKNQLQTTLALINYTAKFEDLGADLIIEAIPEKLLLKQDFFQKIALQNQDNAILATNTSSIPITAIASAIPQPERVIGIHFFNPAHIMKLVEVISGEATSDEVSKCCVEFVKKLGKKPVLAKDSPGFIVNRVARHYYIEALKLMEEGVADFETIDMIMESQGFKMGPFKLMDLIGIDTNYSVTESMFELFNYENRFRPVRAQKQKVLAGFHGRKTGRGFYKY